MEQLMRSLVPFERLADVRYRVCRDQKKPMHLLGGGGRMHALETFCLVDATSTSPGASLRTQTQAQTQTDIPVEARAAVSATEKVRTAFADAVTDCLTGSPKLESLDVWTGDDTLLLPLRLSLLLKGSLTWNTVCLRRAGGGEERPASPGEAFLRMHVSDVGVRADEGAPSMKMPGTGVDWVDSPYEW